MNMDGDEMEMSKEELQKWIREKVKSQLISTDVLEKYSLLQSMLKRREEKAAQLLKLCQSVAACEAIVKKQYSLLGWEYRDTDSDNDDEKSKICGNTLPTPCVRSETPAFEALLLKLEESENLECFIKRKPVVVLTRLPFYKIRSLLPPTPQDHCSDDESLKTLNDSDSDPYWEPDDESCDSDISISTYNSGSKKRRKIDQSNETPAKRHATPQASTNMDAKSNATSAPQASTNTDAKSNGTSASQKAPANTNGVTSLSVKPPGQSSLVATKTPVSAPIEELKVNMTVLARKKAMSWKQGKIMEIIPKDDKLRYKISFDEKGKRIVSGYHIALTSLATVDQLFIGCRVVIKCVSEEPRFCPGILAEVPSRKNRMRFLIFTDDHTPIYAGLPLLHQVHSPMTNPLDDIPDGFHKDFMKDYLRSMPFPPQSSYRVGQTLNAEFEGVQQKCRVQDVDCSLIQVVFETDQHEEWIYRGSMRLEHMIRMKGHLKKSATVK
uniref:histone-lysine N-methyltransferase SETDB1-B-like isoform X1 n=2 Tax=Semicossyphus pulcher TaxID=241346 RepID=UPI0037E77747